MKTVLSIIIGSIMICSCETTPSKQADAATKNPIEGTWKLVSSTTIKGNDSTFIDFTKGQEMIKMINDSHFAFLRHDTNQGNDSANIIFGAGGGTYTLSGDKYNELLQYCNDRGWEGHNFSFTVELSGDTLLQKGVEKLEKENIDQFIIEKYVRVK